MITIRYYIVAIMLFFQCLIIHHEAAAQQDILKTNRPLRIRGEIILTVGQDKGDLQGKDDKIIQAGIEYLHRIGGGVLRIYPGVYDMNNALYLRTDVTLRGSGENTVLRKTDGVVTLVKRDVDWYEYAVEVEKAAGFVRGGGIMLRSKAGSNDWQYDTFTSTITEIEGDLIYLDNMPYKNFWVNKKATAATIFPIITAVEKTNNVRIEDLVLEGNKDNNELINGNYAGAVFIQNCNQWDFENVTVRNYNGDGYSFQICNDIHFENCTSLNNSGLGFHPGSGSQRPVFRNCTSTGNDQGIFFCWGVSFGLAENCTLSNNRKYGISIGHRDTDNMIRNCKIENNGEVGILFRTPTDKNDFLAAHRNTIEDCDIFDNGNKNKGIGIDIAWGTNDISLKKNRIGNANQPYKQKIGVRINESSMQTILETNTFTDIPVKIEDHRR